MMHERLDNDRVRTSSAPAKKGSALAHPAGHSIHGGRSDCRGDGERAGTGAGCPVVVDATGVGVAALDLLKQAQIGRPLVPVVITGGEREAVVDGIWRVPKRDLIIGLQLMFESGEVKIAERLAAGPRLVDELMSMRVRVSLAGREEYAAWREGTHDDLVLTLALACWQAKKAPGNPQPAKTWFDRLEELKRLHGSVLASG